MSFFCWIFFSTICNNEMTLWLWCFKRIIKSYKKVIFLLSDTPHRPPQKVPLHQKLHPHQLVLVLHPESQCRLHQRHRPVCWWEPGPLLGVHGGQCELATSTSCIKWISTSAVWLSYSGTETGDSRDQSMMVISTITKNKTKPQLH